MKLLLLLLTSYCGYSQSGTLIIASIVPNRIVLAADSRGAFYVPGDNSKTIIATIDSSVKIFKLKQFSIGITGVGSLGGIFFTEIIRNFNNSSPLDTSLINTVKKFKSFLDSKFPNDAQRDSIAIIGCGFVNLKPQIIYFVRGQVQLENSTSIWSDSTASKYSFKLDPALSIIDKIHKTMTDCAEGENKTRTIGGPISIVEIMPNNEQVWIENNFSSHYFTTIQELYDAVKNETIKVTYYIPNAKAKLLEYIKQAIINTKSRVIF